MLKFRLICFFPLSVGPWALEIFLQRGSVFAYNFKALLISLSWSNFNNFRIWGSLSYTIQSKFCIPTHVYGASWWIKTRRSLFNRSSQLYIGNSVPPPYTPQNPHPIQDSCGCFFFVCYFCIIGVFPIFVSFCELGQEL